MAKYRADSELRQIELQIAAHPQGVGISDLEAALLAAGYRHEPALPVA